MLAADERPGAFLEDELPFAPRAAEPPADPADPVPAQDPWGWFQRWRVPITALFVVLIALAVALAFGAKPDDPPIRVPLGSVPGGPVPTVTPAGSASTDGTDALASPAAVISPPLASGPVPSDPAGSAPLSSGAIPSSTTAPGSGSTAVPGRPATTTTPTPTTPTPTAPASTGASATSPAQSGSTTRSPTSQPSTARPPASATTVPGYATGPTQARGPNDPPFIANPGLVVTTVGQPARYQIGVSARPGEVLAFSATGLPRGLSIDPATGLVTGTTPAPETTGVQVTVTSSTGSSFTQGFTWAVSR